MQPSRRHRLRQYEDAREYFRSALQADPAAFEPLVNLGGVLLTLNQVDEAYPYNLYAVLKRPRDEPDLAEKHRLEARRLDTAHFSHPHLLLEEIYLRRHDSVKAADQLEDFLGQHPDWPNNSRMRTTIDNLRRR